RAGGPHADRFQRQLVALTTPALYRVEAHRYTSPGGSRMGDMTYRRLGGSGLEVSTVGLGCNNFGTTLDLDASRGVLEAALDEGITLLDTADCYGQSEDVLGEL